MRKDHGNDSAKETLSLWCPIIADGEVKGQIQESDTMLGNPAMDWLRN